MLCNIKPVPFHESDKDIFAKIPGGGPDPRSPPSGSAHVWYVASSSGPQVCSYDGPGVKTCPVPGVTSWNRRTKKDSFEILVGLEL